jgi:hypothetical protein
MTVDDLLTEIEARAQLLWGDRWFPELVSAYLVARYGAHSTARYRTHGGQIRRALDSRKMTHDNVLLLLGVVGLRIRVEVVKDQPGSS